MKQRLMSVLGLLFVSSAVGAHAQWLNYPTPGIPRTADGKADLSAPAPRGPDGKPDLSGIWQGGLAGISVPHDALTPQSNALLREREENYQMDHPAFHCQPSGPEIMAGWKRIVQGPRLTMILDDDLTYRIIFTDGRTLEADPYPTWMGYSVGRWERDTFVVESFGFNDRTWLDRRGLPHTEALRMTERYQRRNVGQLHVEVTVTDPGAFAGSWTAAYDLQFRPDTEMIEAVCEDKSRFIGRLSEAEQTKVVVPSSRLAKYVGVYSGLWGQTPRTMRVRLEAGTLHANGVFGNEDIRLIPQSESYFVGTNGLTYDFDTAGDPAAFIVERHVSGDWKYSRQREGEDVNRRK
jgi:hypothetical protein